jgi:hypothetical protein
MSLGYDKPLYVLPFDHRKAYDLQLRPGLGMLRLPS